MTSRVLSLSPLLGAALCFWTIASCAQPVDDSGWVGQLPTGGSGGAVLGGAAGSTGGDGGGTPTGGAAGDGGSATGGSSNTGGNNTGGTTNTGGTGGSTGGTGSSSSGGYGGTGGSSSGGYGGTGSSSSGGYGGTGGSSSGGYGGTGGSSSGGYGGTGGNAGSCDFTSGVAACDTCMESKCWDECAACSANIECSLLLDCLNTCYGDPYCEDDCMYYYSGGVDDLFSFLGSTSGCVPALCSSSCQ